MEYLEKLIEALECEVAQLRVRVDFLEEAQTKSESVAAACLGAGCPRDGESPPRLGAGEILSKMWAFRDGHAGVIEVPGYWSEDYSSGYLDARKELIQHLGELLGVEAQASCQDGK